MKINDREWFDLNPDQQDYYREPTDQERIEAAQAGHPGINLMWVLLDDGEVYRVRVLNAFPNQHLMNLINRMPEGIPLDLLVKECQHKPG